MPHSLYDGWNAMAFAQDGSYFMIVYVSTRWMSMDHPIAQQFSPADSPIVAVDQSNNRYYMKYFFDPHDRIFFNFLLKFPAGRTDNERMRKNWHPV